MLIYLCRPSKKRGQNVLRTSLVLFLLQLHLNTLKGTCCCYFHHAYNQDSHCSQVWYNLPYTEVRTPRKASQTVIHTDPEKSESSCTNQASRKSCCTEKVMLHWESCVALRNDVALRKLCYIKKYMLYLERHAASRKSLCIEKVMLQVESRFSLRK